MVTQAGAASAKLPPASEAAHADADAPAQEMRTFFGRQREQAADQIALGQITLFLESFQPGLSADAWLLQALSPKREARQGRVDVRPVDDGRQRGPPRETP